MKYGLKTILISSLILLTPLCLFHLFNIPHATMLSLLVSIVLFWFLEIIPLPMTGLLVPTLATVYQLTTAKEAFSSFGNPILFLFIGSFFFTVALQKHRWDQRMTFTLLSTSLAGSSTWRLLFFIALLCWTLSMWISNTAACAIIAPIILGIMNVLKEYIADEKEISNLTIKSLLCCAFASSIGGMATPVGSPPNALAIQFLQQQGITLNFFQWMLYGLPISLMMLIALLILIHKLFPTKNFNLDAIKEHFSKEKENLGPLKLAEIQVLSAFLLAVFLWIFPGLVEQIFPKAYWSMTLQARFPMGAVAILCSGVLFFLPTGEVQKRNLNWDDVKNIDWGTILLFGGGLTLGTLLDKTGTAADLGKFLFQVFQEKTFLLGAILIVFAILTSEFSSNTASAALIIPLILGSSTLLGPNLSSSLVISTAFAASFGFMLPVSTPPNAIVYGTGRIPIRSLIRAGLAFDILGFLIILFSFKFFFPLISSY